MEKTKNEILIERFVSKCDYVGAGLFAGGMILKSLKMEFSAVAMILGLTLLATSSVYKAQIKSGFTTVNEIFLYKISCFVAAIGLILVLFFMLNWPKAMMMFWVFCSAIPIILIISFATKVQIFKIIPYYERLKIAGALLLFIILYKY